MLITQRNLTLKNLKYVIHHPSILKNIIQGKSKDEIRTDAID